MTKRNLSIIELIISVITAILLYVDGMFIWRAWDVPYGTNQVESPLSFNNVFGTQLDLGFFNVLMVLLIVVCAIVSIIVIFKRVDKLDKKYMIILPAITLILFVILGIYANSYIGTSTYMGMARHYGPSLNILFYIEAILLAANVFIECAKHFIEMPYSK